MSKKWCNHCFRVVESTKLADAVCDLSFEKIKVCPFCGATEGDLFKKSFPPGVKHGDSIGYPGNVKK